MLGKRAERMVDQLTVQVVGRWTGDIPRKGELERFLQFFSHVDEWDCLHPYGTTMVLVFRELQ